jgi:hypothetical protein
MYVKLSWRPEVMAARITKYLNKYVRRGICLIYMSSIYFWSPSFARKIRKTNMRYYPEYPSGSWHPILFIRVFGSSGHHGDRKGVKTWVNRLI